MHRGAKLEQGNAESSQPTDFNGVAGQSNINFSVTKQEAFQSEAYTSVAGGQRGSERLDRDLLTGMSQPTGSP